MVHPQSLPGSAGRAIERLRFHAEHTPSPPRSDRWLQRETVWHRTWHFADAGAATRWNEGWERAIHEDQIHPAFCRIAGKRIREPLVEGLANLVAGVLLEDCQAGSPHPVALPGGSYHLTIRFQHQRAHRRGGMDSLLLRLHGDVIGDDGATCWSSDVLRSYGPELIPVALVCLWHSRRWEATVEGYESRVTSG
jgi:hypothetical protein